MKDLTIKENGIIKSEKSVIKENDENYQRLINIYGIALTKTKDIMENIQKKLRCTVDMKLFQK